MERKVGDGGEQLREMIESREFCGFFFFFFFFFCLVACMSLYRRVGNKNGGKGT